MAGLSFPYPMKAAVDHEVRHAQVEYTLKLGVPWLPSPGLPPHDRWLNVAAYGPSLHDTWERIPEDEDLVTCSGSMKFLLQRGRKPTFHVDMDPRPHKLAFLRDAPDGVTYYLASVCHPQMWKLMEGKYIYAWHFYCGKESVKWVAENDPAHAVIVAGSSVGLGAIRIGIELGYRKFRIYGIDNSFQDGMRHAGAHFGAPHEIIEQEAGGKMWPTSKVMSNCAAETCFWLENIQDCQFEVHGQGMQQSMLTATHNLKVVP